MLYIDTEGTFVVQRAVDIAAATVRHCSLLVEDDEQRVAMETFSVDSILSNMFLVSEVKPNTHSCYSDVITLTSSVLALAGALP